MVIGDTAELCSARFHHEACQHSTVPGKTAQEPGVAPRHWKNVSVVNPAAHMGIGLGDNDDEREEDLRVGELMRLWGPDPVHPTETAYDH